MPSFAIPKGIEARAWIRQREMWLPVFMILLPPALRILEVAGLFIISPVMALTMLLLASLALIRIVLVSRRLMRQNHALIRREQSLHDRAYTDPLTGLMNRIAFNRALEESAGRPDTEFAILFFDLDRFKDVNDTLGHKTGDLLLVAVAERLVATLPSDAIVARIGGDEFATILALPCRPDPEQCAMAVVEALDEPFEIEGSIVQIGTAVGVASGTIEAGSDELLKRADLAMYEAKARGFSGYQVFDDSLSKRIAAQTGIRVELARSIAENQLDLHYQPIVAARGGQVESAEALLRWRNPTLGDVSPAVVIPVAEESGQILELSAWTLHTALKAIKRLGDIPVAVNISPVYFRHQSFISSIADRLIETGVRPEMLIVEITEGVLISNMDAAKRSISQLRNMGVKVHLDDFGTGYSSLSYLQNFELDGMKIDKSFLRNVGEKTQATQIMRSVINLGHSLGLRVVVEGVENDWQARLLQLLGCDSIQGFHIATPMPLDRLIDMRSAISATVIDHPAMVANEQSASMN